MSFIIIVLHALLSKYFLFCSIISSEASDKNSSSISSFSSIPVFGLTYVLIFENLGVSSVSESIYKDYLSEFIIIIDFNK
jgi:hypothetical protein